MNTSASNRQSPSIFRKQLIMPAEHGSWSWFLVPWASGAFIAGQFNLAVWLTLTAGLSVFLMRQPATVWFRVRRGRARQSDGPAATGWVAGFAIIALLSVAGLLRLERTALLWLAGPLVLIFGLYLLAARSGRTGLRSLWMELAGAAALALMAPAALVAAQGRFSGQEWALWAIMATQNMSGALYVRLRILDTHQRPIDRAPIVWGHGLGLAAVGTLAIMDAAPELAVIPFVGFMLRVIWAAASRRPVSNVKRFGFGEMGIEILGGAIVVASYWIGG